MEKVNNGYTNYVVLSRWSGYVWVQRTNDPRPHAADGPFTFQERDLKHGHIDIKIERAA